MSDLQKAFTLLHFNSRPKYLYYAVDKDDKFNLTQVLMIKSLFYFDLDAGKFERHDRIWRVSTAFFLTGMDIAVTTQLDSDEAAYAIKLGIVIVTKQYRSLPYNHIQVGVAELIEKASVQTTSWGVSQDWLSVENNSSRFGSAVREAVGTLAVRERLRLFDLGSTWETVRDLARYNVKCMNLFNGAPVLAGTTDKRRIVIAIIPAGSGKTSIAKRGFDGPFIVRDVDDYYAKEDKELGKRLRRRGLEGDQSAWDELNAILNKLLLDGLEQENGVNVLLVHGMSAAACVIEKYDTAIFIGKVSEEALLKVVSERSKTDPDWGRLTLKNWEDTKCEIFRDHEALYQALDSSIKGQKNRMFDIIIRLAAVRGKVYSDSVWVTDRMVLLGIRNHAIREANVYISEDMDMLLPGFNYIIANHDVVPDVHHVKYQLPYSGWLNNKVLFVIESAIMRRGLVTVNNREVCSLRGLDTRGDWSQEQALLMSPVISNRNILTYSYTNGDLPVSIFAISNTSNSRKEIVSFIKRMPKGIFVLPYDVSETCLIENFRYVDGMMSNIAGGYNDYTFEPIEFMDDETECYSMIDFIFLSGAKVQGINAQHLGMKLWFVVCRGISLQHAFDGRFYNSQTHVIKKTTGLLRKVTLTNDDVLMSMRRRVMLTEVIEGVTDVEIIESERVSGKIKYKGKVIFVAVAGHMINLLLAHCYTPIDMRRAMGAIRSNLVEYESKVFDQAGYAERFVRDLWHGYFDWLYGIRTYRYMCEFYKLRYRKESAEYAERELENMASQFGWFLSSEGFQSKIYRGSL